MQVKQKPYQTNHFPSIYYALSHFFPKFSGHEVRDMLREGKIYIGKPPLKNGETAFVRNKRYHVNNENSNI